ncbi:MAG: hypothetical protein ACI8S6_004405 [Myxococcota bacterium]|jgi:hypothetical protein
MSREIAAGEDRRRDEGLVHITDAMLYEEPSQRAWQVLVGVVDALAQQLDPAAFAEAVEVLAAEAERFPEDLRVCPRAWIDIFFATTPDPRLTLIRSLTLDWGTFGWSGKSFAKWVSLLAAAPHVGHLSTINLYLMQSGKAPVTALTELFQAARPDRWRLQNSKSRFEASLLEAFEAAGVTAERQTDYVSEISPPKRTDVGALDDAEVSLTLKDNETLEALLAREDLDHVVSLEVGVDFEWIQKTEPPAVKPAAPRWRKLRHLTLNLQSGHCPQISALVGDWLQHARPVCVEVTEQGVSAPLLGHGVFHRALGSELYLPDLDDARSALASGRLRVMGLIQGDDASTPRKNSTRPLVKCLPPTTRAALRVLNWRLLKSEFSHIESIVSALPALAIWCPSDPEVTDSRQDLVEALAAAPTTARIRLLIPHEPYRGGHGKTAALVAKHAKMLDRGEGLASGAYVVYGNSSYPYRITW